MKIHAYQKFASRFVHDESTSRRGAFLILSVFCLTACFIFVSLAVDIGFINLVKQQMQNAVDSAALAAAQEITSAVNNAPADVQDVTQYALDQARLVAVNVAQLNGVYVEPQRDVIFGSRSYNPVTETFEIEWGKSPANVVKVVSRRDGEDASSADGKLALFFAGFTGDQFAKVVADAVAYVEARDLVVVHDFSRSMNFDSYFNGESNQRLSNDQILENLAMAYQDLNPAVGEVMTFFPRYLEVSETQDGVTCSVEFRNREIAVLANEEITEVVLEFENGNQQTIPTSGTSRTISGTGSNSQQPIVAAWVKCEVEQESMEVNQTPATLTGARPRKKSQPQIYVTFSGDRQSVNVTSSKDLSNVVLEFCDGVHYKFDGLSGKNRTFAGLGNHAGKIIKTVWVKSGSNSSNDGPGYGERFNNPTAGDDCGAGGTPTVKEIEFEFRDTNDQVKAMLALHNIPYPYPSGSWDGMINHARYDSELEAAGYGRRYGGLTLLNYILRYHAGNWQTPDLWKTRHYPFHAIKEGHMLLCDFLQNLGFDDRIGMVSYDTYHRQETILSENDPNIPYVNISSEPITNDYNAVKNLMKYKQAAHYAYATNMGGGLADAIDMLTNSARAGTQRAILLMTDGNTNTMDPGANTSLPGGWDWDELFDYDGDGNADYYTSSSQRRHVLRTAYEARSAGMTVHTMSVGADADAALMRAIAHLSSGYHINVPGGVTVSEMETEVEAAFHRIASFVPPAKLLHDE